jgi:hypothetical protein
VISNAPHRRAASKGPSQHARLIRPVRPEHRARAALWTVATVIALYLIPAVLVGYLAQRSDRERQGWTLFGVLLGWPIALATLLIIGRSQPSEPQKHPAIPVLSALPSSESTPPPSAA